MKLIFCASCRDIVKLRLGTYRTCFCGESGGRYIDRVNAHIGGKAIPLGIRNDEFYAAIRNQPREGAGEEFCAFVIAEECPTIEVVQNEAGG